MDNKLTEASGLVVSMRQAIIDLIRHQQEVAVNNQKVAELNDRINKLLQVSEEYLPKPEEKVEE